MPVIVAVAIRSIIQMAVTLGIIQIVQSTLIPLIEKALVAIAEAFGCSAEDAQDILANEYLQFAEQVGIGVLVLRAKTPTLIAEKLGFTSKGWVKRPIKASTQAKFKPGDVATVANKPLTQVEEDALLKGVAVKKGITFQQVNDVTSFAMKIVGFPFVIIYTIAQVIDFGNWNAGAYQKTLQRVIAFVTFGLLVPDPKVPQSNVLSKDVWDRTYQVYKEMGATTINDPYKGQKVPFSRQNLIDLVDKIAAQMLAEGQTAGLKQILAATTVLIDAKDTTTTSTASAPVSQATTTAKVTVFTGVVSQGVLGNGIVFSPRTTDMIDDVDELVQSASVNLANFLMALPSRVIYEIKIVSSITTKDGFTQRGSTNQVQVGTYANGAPKFKTVTNKFAVLYLYLLTDKGTKTKIAQINVGPVNAINFQVTSNDLNAVAERLKGVVTTSNVSDITSIVSTTPITVAPPAPVVLPLPNYNISTKVPGDLGYAFYFRPADKSNPERYIVVPNYKFYDPTYSQVTEEVYRRATGDTKDYTNSGYYLNAGVFTKATDYAPSDTKPQATQAEIAKANLPWSGSLNATSIAKFYDPEGLKYPSVAERAVLYEQYGLGSKTLYIGSTEQNIALLAKLKGF